MKLQGKAWKFGDDVNTDLIIPGKYLELTDPNEMAKHAMEGIDPAFPQRIKTGDVVVAGRNFGCGSSREHAPLALKHAGVGAIIAESYARIFYRNSINVGLPALESHGVLKSIDPGDNLKIDLKGGSIMNITKGISIRFIPLPAFMVEVLEMGGLTAYLKSHIGEW